MATTPNDLTSYDVEYGLVFKGTKVPVDKMWEYAKAGRDLSEFLRDYQDVSESQLMDYIAWMSQVRDDFESKRSANAKVTPASATWEQVKGSLYVDLAHGDCRHALPSDAVRYRIGEQFDAYFYVDLDGGPNFVITKSDLVRWQISMHQFVMTATFDPAASWDWPKLNDSLVYRFPDRDIGWIYHLIEPGCLLEHKVVSGQPLVFVPVPDVAFLTGLNDLNGQRAMLEESIRLTQGKPPITLRPIVINENWTQWSRLKDEQNPLAAEYKRAFG